MKFTGKSIIQKATAILIIFNLLIVNFAIVGKNAVSYAIDVVKTNSNNVEFSAYFVDDKSEQVSSIEKSINAEDLKLYVEVSVKNEGYFNGQITLEESNFKLKEEFTDANISKIEGNTVTLKQINAGSTVKLELGIEPIKEEVLEKESLDAESKVNLTGTYISSKKDTEIEGIANVKLSLKSPEEAKAVLETNLLTNSVYKKEGENKKIVQLLISSNVENNSYPVKETNIELNVPKDTEKVEVKKRGAGATESTLELDESSYKYDVKNQKLTINLKNEQEDEKIKWSKDGKDELIVTFILPENADTKEQKTVVEDKITLYDEKELVAKTEVDLGEEKEGAITYNVTSEESKIYKGKIYTGEERAYNVKTSINVNYIGAASDIKLEEKASTYLVGEKEARANITYKQSKINKDEFIRILGEEGFLTIKNQDGAIIANINADREVEQDGNFVINYPSNVTTLTVETSEPVNVGVLEINHTKSINNAEYTRGQLRQVTQIRNLVTGSYVVENEERVQDAENKIDLKETKSQAKLEVGTETLSTTAKNENVKIKATLCTDGEYKDIFKNPTLKITLPSQIINVDAKCKLLYGNGLNLSEAKVVEEDGHKVIYIKLDGEQAGYQGEAVKGPTVVVYADLELDKLAASSNEQIVLNYTNENAQEYADGGVVKKDIEVVSEMSLITTNNISEYGVETLGNEGTKRIDLERNTDSKNAQIDISITNNEESKIENVKILGKFPTKVENDESNNLEVALASGISMENDNAKVYYSNKADPSDDLQDSNNGWGTTGSSKETKSYLIVIDSLEVGESFNANYKITIPEGLGYNLSAKESYSVTYTNTANSQVCQSQSTEILLTTGKGPEIQAEVVAMQGDEELKEGATVHAGEVITYRIKLQNVGTEDAVNVKVTGGVPEGTTYIRTEKDVYEAKDISISKIKYNEIEEYLPTFVAEKVVAKKTATIEYQVKVDEDIKNIDTVINQVKIEYNDVQTQIENKMEIEKGTLKLDLKSGTRMENEILLGGSKVSYELNVKNIADKKINNVKIDLVSNEALKIDAIKYINDEKTYEINDTNTFTIEKLEKNETINIQIIATVQQNVPLENTSIYVKGKYNEVEYISQTIKEKAKIINVSMKLEADKEGADLKPGDEINYKISINNIGNVNIENYTLKDYMKRYLEIQTIQIDGEATDFDTSYIENEDAQIVYLHINIPANEKQEIVINARVNDSLINGEDLQIINYATLILGNTQNIETNSIINTVICNSTEEKQAEIVTVKDKKEDSNGEYELDRQPYTNEETEEENNEKATRMITGLAWIDENQNGLRDSQESFLSNIDVKLLEVNKNEILTNESGEEVIVKTGDDGKYTFSKIPQGQYLAMFDYDDKTYSMTKYQTEETLSNQCSDVETTTMSISGVNKQYAVTDVLDLNSSNYANINMGVVENKDFDMELKKYVSKITVSNNKETKTYNYDNATLAKVEIDSKNIKNTNVVIEYKIQVTNTGEVAGYVKNIVDYKPTDLAFSSSLNNDWYQSGEYLYNSNLANIKIEPGETKEVTLVLTKKMNESNIGLINNIAEIASTYNDLGVNDLDSKEGNREKGEDDMAGVDVIIGIATGTIFSYIIITLSIILIVLGMTYLIYKKIIERNIKI